MSISLSFFVCVRAGRSDDGPHFLLGNCDERACYLLFCFVSYGICACRYLGEDYWPSLFRQESGLLRMRLRDHRFLKG